jgi:hypothetical protein
VWTRDVFTFCRVGDEQVIDAIPLCEIKSIEGVGSSPLDMPEKQSSSQHNFRESEVLHEGKW